MTTYQFNSPPLPHYIISGEDTYLAGGTHMARNSIGVFDLIVVTNGSLYLQEDGECFEVAAGQYLLLRPDRSHRAYMPCREETNFYWLHFHTMGFWNEIIDPYLRMMPLEQSSHMSINRFSFYIPRFNTFGEPLLIYDLIQKLNALVDQPNSLARWKQQLLFQELLVKLQDHQVVQNTQYIMIAEKAASFLRQHYRNPLTYSLLSLELHFHPNYISLCMKQVFGCTPLSYLTRYRMEQAKLQLTYGDESVSNIAEEVGFGSLPYFIRCFKRHVGCTPGSYRMQYRS